MLDSVCSPWSRVGKVISFVKGFYPTWDDEYCARLLDSFRLALSWRPILLVLDEPTVGVDAISKQQVFAELLSAVQGEDRAVFISSHAITDLERFADHVGMIKNGRLIFEGETAEVVERYRLVDVTAEHGTTLEDLPGIVVHQRDSRRWRVLVDRGLTPLERLSSMGFAPLADSPVHRG